MFLFYFSVWLCHFVYGKYLFIYAIYKCFSRNSPRLKLTELLTLFYDVSNFVLSKIGLVNKFKVICWWLFDNLHVLTVLDVKALKCRCDICPDKNNTCTTEGYCFTTSYLKDGQIHHNYRWEFQSRNWHRSYASATSILGSQSKFIPAISCTLRFHIG